MLEPLEVAPCTNRCAATGRILSPGEEIISALIQEGGKLRRMDFAAEAWPPDGVKIVAWWRTRVPAKTGGPAPRPKPATLLEIFDQVIASRDQPDLAYVLALALLRRRVLKWEGETASEEGNPLILLSHPKTGRLYQIRAIVPEDKRQAELEELLRSFLRLRTDASTEPSDKATSETSPSLQPDAQPTDLS